MSAASVVRRSATLRNLLGIMSSNSYDLPLNQSSENSRAKARFLTELFGTAEAVPSRTNESRPLTANKIAEEFFHARLFAGVILLGNCSGLLAQF
jgi:hypothetical protein